MTHLFADKTGTLTQNIMVLRKFCHQESLLDADTDLKTQDYNLLLMGMVLCHSVDVADKHFVASSPDEKAILDALQNSGIVFLGVDDKSKVIRYRVHPTTTRNICSLIFRYPVQF